MNNPKLGSVIIFNWESFDYEESISGKIYDNVDKRKRECFVKGV